MTKRIAGKDKIKGMWQYYVCTSCTCNVKIYKVDCKDGIWPKVVDVCRYCVKNFITKGSKMKHPSSHNSSHKDKVRQRKLLGDTKKVAKTKATKKGMTRPKKKK